MYAAAFIGDKIIDLAGWDQGQGAETSGLSISSNYNFQDVAYIGGTYGRQFFRTGTMVSASFTSRFELIDVDISLYQQRLSYFIQTMPIRLANQSGCTFKLSQPYPGQFGTPQVETVTGAGTIVNPGLVKLTLTSSAIDSSPIDIKAVVSTGTPAANWITSLYEQLSTNIQVIQYFNVSKVGLDISITRKSPFAGNDSTLLMVIANDTCTGVTTTTSVNTTAGVAMTPMNNMTFYDANVAVAVTQLGTSVMLNTSVTGRLTSP